MFLSRLLKGDPGDENNVGVRREFTCSYYCFYFFSFFSTS